MSSFTYQAWQNRELTILKFRRVVVFVEAKQRDNFYSRELTPVAIGAIIAETCSWWTETDEENRRREALPLPSPVLVLGALTYYAMRARRADKLLQL
jgi:hypothetical protein